MTSPSTDLRGLVGSEVAAREGVLPLEPAWVGRSWLPPGRRLGLDTEAYELGERGAVCERWLASTTHADNAVGPDDEGLSFLSTASGEAVTLAAAVAAAPDVVLGAAYAASHDGLGRLAKIFDYGARIPFHIHPPAEYAARVGRSSKDEAYWFPPGVDLGAQPESFLGLLPSADREHAGPGILDELRAWDSDTVLRYSQAYRQVAGDGFFIPSGVLHAPGTALTVELQEESDAMAMFQALNAGRIIDKELLFKDVCEDDRCRLGEAALLDWVDWDENTDPYFYDHHHAPPLPFRTEDGLEESWVFYGSPKFCGKLLTLDPGRSTVLRERGPFSVLVWQGTGTVGPAEVVGGTPGCDELLVVGDRAVAGVEVTSTGDVPLLMVSLFGPDVVVGALGAPGAPGAPRPRST